MEIFLFSFVIMGIALLGMGLGVLCGRQGIRGSCGGLNSGECGICTDPCEHDDTRRSSDERLIEEA